ncbi:MAG: Mut7-C RNAse domain-containing protein [Candidatus Hodarchaeota archaeon]
MKIIADCMLGKLARWLRFCGNHVYYSSKASDDQILALLKDYKAKKEGLLITRDKQLSKRATVGGYESILIQPTKVLLQLKQVLASEWGESLECNPFLATCAACSTKLKEIPPEKALLQLETDNPISSGYNSYYQCTNSSCMKIYWRGPAWRDAFSRLCSIINKKRLQLLIGHCETELDLLAREWSKRIIQKHIESLS